MALTTAPAIDYALPRQQDEGDHWIDDWRPEDPVFWETIGRPIARRNLILPSSPSTSASACGCCGASWLSR